MGIPPTQPQDLFESINSNINSNLSTGFSTPNQVPAGYADRQKNIPYDNVGTRVRNMVRWLVPNSGVVEMYINPRSISYSYKKLIQPTKTKGGFSLQYWGEDLIRLRISGTTGSSGIEGINVLYDVYRSEQLAFDPYALALAANSTAQNESALSAFGIDAGSAAGIAGNIANLFSGQNTIPKVAYQHPTLATLAFQVEMYWSGWVYRGYFDSFTVEESADKLGLFDYNIDFVATQRRGRRENFLPWHRNATSGPSNNQPPSKSGSSGGVPYTFSAVTDNLVSPVINKEQNNIQNQTSISIWNDLKNQFNKF